MATNYSAVRDDALGESDMTELLSALKHREVSPAELYDAARERLREAQEVLNAVVVTTEVPSGTGPLAGIPSVLKDNLDLAGYATREGSRAVPDRVHSQDSAFTADLKATGLAFLAKSTLPEFGLTASTEPLLTGPTRNPWHLDRSTGGSSGGSAALVAAGAVPVAHANDGGGSIRIPASCCGLVGLKVSRGRVTDAESEKFLPVSIASEGVVTRTVRDTALLYSLLERPMAGVPPIGHVRGPGKRRLRVALVTQGVPVQHVDAEVVAAVQRTGGLLADLGHHVQPTTLALPEQFGRDFLRYWAALAAFLQLGGGRMFGPGWDGDQLEPLTKGLADYCRTMVTGVPGMLTRLRAFPQTYATMFADCDVILSPVLAAPPVPIGYLSPDIDPRTHIIRLLRYASFTAAQNVAGAPGIAVPAGTSSEGTPIGVHLGGPFGSEASLLELAYELEGGGTVPARPSGVEMTGSNRPARTALALTNGLLIDGTGAEPIRGATVLVDAEGTISYAGVGTLAPEIPSGTSTVDVGGNAILPGFFDCHVHFCLPGGAADIGLTLALPASLKVFQIAERMRITLEAGVTSARDLMGVDVGFRMAVDAGVIAGPRLVLSVGIVSSTGGHGDMTQLSGINVLPYLQSPGCFPAVADGEDEVRAMTRRILQAGADVVKIAATGGVLTPTDRPDDVGMSVAEIRAVVEEARSRRGGVHVAAHAQGRRGIQNALDGGVDSIEHGYDLTAEQRAQMVDGGTFLVPTLSEVMGSLDPSAGPVALAKKALWQGKARTNFPAAVAAGVKIAAGTDAGAAPEHGHNLRELGLLVDNGLTPMQAIVAATRHSAELCQLDHLVGTLDAGKRADIVVSNGNPLSNIALLGDPGNILLVVKDGVVAKDRAGFLTEQPVSTR